MLQRYLLALLAALTLLLTTTSRTAQAQTGSVGIGTSTPAASAALDVSSTSKGLLIPRLSQTQRDAIASPATGLQVYNTTTNKLNVWNGTSWDAALSATEQPVTYATQTFGYTGAPQTYTVPAGVTSVRIDALGAQGGGSTFNYAPLFPGGNGARVQARLAVTSGQVLTLYVGGRGTTPLMDGTDQPGGGGYNGGGHGGQNVGNAIALGGGGGASDVRVGNATLYDRVLVAAGGGGGGGGEGGVGGAPQGAAGGGSNAGAGASTAFGNAVGQGGSSNAGSVQAGGGGGVYGGYAGGHYGGGGGGGSSVYNNFTPGLSEVTLQPGEGNGDGAIVISIDPAYAAPALDGSNFVNVAGAWQVNGSDVYRSSGKVGIGTNTPAQKLDVVGNAFIRGRVGIGTSSPDHPLTVQAGADSNSPLLGFSSAAGFDKYNFSLDGGGLNLSESNVASGRLFVRDGGNVGIGTTTPGQKLEVAGQIYSSTGGIRFPDNTVQTTAATLPDAIMNQATLQAGASFNISGNGYVGGNVGVGTTTPAQKLDVNGNATVSGSMGIGTAMPAASAALEVSSTTKGLLPPRLSQTERNAIASPAAGLTLYNTTTGKLNTWNGTRWDAGLSTAEQSVTYAPQTFTYTGAPQTYTVPDGVYSLSIDAAGAQGGNAGLGSAAGKGARVQATLTVTPGEVLTLYVGGAGLLSTASSNGGGGYNGGGEGYFKTGYLAGGGGGGASDVRRSVTATSTALADRVLVAAGGGGKGDNGAGGHGGAPNGEDGVASAGYTPGTGATQSAGGSQGGSLGQGGNGQSGSASGGGGGGYYGGGGAGLYASGGGGSSWVTPTGISGVAMSAGYRSGNGVIVLTPSVANAAPVLDGRNFVNVPGDNLGSHTATQNLNLATYKLVGNGGSTGLAIASNGAVTTAGALTTGGNVSVTGTLTTTGAIAAGGNVQLGSSQLVGNGGTTGITIATNGNVGIGSASAGAKLHVAGSANVTGNTTIGGTASVAGSVGIGTSSSGHPLTVQAGAAINSPLLGFYSQDGVDKYNFSLAGGGLNLSESGVAGGRLFVRDGGYVGIGTTTPSAGLHVDRPETSSTAQGVLLSGGSSGNPNLELRGNGKTPYIDFAESDVDFTTRLLSYGGILNVQRGTGSGTLLNVQGGLQCVGAVNTSDQRLKQNIRPLRGALASVLQLRGVRYEWNVLGVQRGGTAGAGQVGVLAQEVEKIYPELVNTDADGYKAVNYAQLTPVLIEALKELAAQNEVLRTRAAAAEAKATTAEAKAAQATATLDTFEARLRRLESQTGGQARK